MKKTFIFMGYRILSLLLFLIIVQSCTMPKKDLSNFNETVDSLLVNEYRIFSFDSLYLKRTYYVKRISLLTEGARKYIYRFEDMEEVMEYIITNDTLELASFVSSHGLNIADTSSIHGIAEKTVSTQKVDVYIRKYLLDVESIDGHSFLFESPQYGMIARYIPSNKILLWVHPPSLSPSFSLEDLDSKFLFQSGIPVPPPPPDK